MPASMMMAATGGSWNVAGSSSDIVPTGPMPGRTPMRVPTNTPTKQTNRLAGCSATWRPSAMLWRVSILGRSNPQRSLRERHTERPDDEARDHRDEDGGEECDPPALACHDEEHDQHQRAAAGKS